jgi:hypothetical protein
MKSFITTAFFACISFFTVFAAGKPGISVTTVNLQTSPLSQVLSLYYNVKDALVNSDASAAASKAGELLKAITAIETKSLSAAEQKAFAPLQDKLAFDARHISESKAIEHQREHFTNLSANIYTLAKSVKLSDKPVYRDYCPMKKSYWLSSDAAIKNPYYGQMMLTCGKVTETIK